MATTRNDSTREERMHNRGALDAQSDLQPIIGLRLVDVIEGGAALDHVVQSKIYPEDPDVLFLTLRGGGFRTFDISIPSQPEILGGWNSTLDVEGQDRKDDLLIVVARYGALLTFDVSNPATPTLLAELPLKTNASSYEALIGALLTRFGNGPFGALHTKLYDAADGRRYALITATETGKLIAVDVSDPKHPHQVSSLDTGVHFIEGIYIYGDRSYHGGFGNSELFVSVDISDPHQMTIVDSITNSLFSQMVTEMKTDIPHILFAALWSNPGGLATFDISDDAHIQPMDSLFRPELSKSNRVKITDSFAFLPLEQDPGGVGIIDISDVSSLKFIGLADDILSITTPYTLEIKENYLYLFSSDEDTMAVLEIIRGEPNTDILYWDFQQLSDTSALDTGLPAMIGNGSIQTIDSDNGASQATLSQLSIRNEFGYQHLRIDGSVPWEKNNGLSVRHSLDNLFYGSLTGYTMVWDLLIPETAFTVQGCRDGSLWLCNDIPLLQLDRRNQNDANLFIKIGRTAFSSRGSIGKSNAIFVEGGLEGYANGIEPNTWHRIAFVVDLYGEEPQARIYLDGNLIKEVEQISYPLFSAVAEGNPNASDLLTSPNAFLLFADNNGEFSTEIRLREYMFSNRPFSASEVNALGRACDGSILLPKQ